jgi:hypothetical protein
MLENTATSTNGTRKTKYPHIEIIIVTDWVFCVSHIFYFILWVMLNKWFFHPLKIVTSHFFLSFFLSFCHSCPFKKNFYSYVHTMFGSFLPPSPHPPLTTPALLLPPTPSLPGRNYFALISNFVEERV